MPLTLNEVSHRYGPGLPWVARRVSLEIADGETVALMGPSGSGKTTLLSILGLLTRPTEGHVLVDGRPTVGDRAAVALRASLFSWVFQTANALPRRSALDNAALPLLVRGVDRPTASRIAAAELRRLGVSHLAARPARLLSGGELQRVCIGRALAAAPRWILADEPTGQLDHRSTAAAADALFLGRPIGTGVIVATHDPDLAARCERVFRLSDGCLTGEARP